MPHCHPLHHWGYALSRIAYARRESIRNLAYPPNTALAALRPSGWVAWASRRVANGLERCSLAMHAEFFVRMFEVLVNGSLADAQFLGDALPGAPALQGQQDLLLAAGQLPRQRSLSPRRDRRPLSSVSGTGLKAYGRGKSFAVSLAAGPLAAARPDGRQVRVV